ncbi:MAG TPA: hypothetical protein VHK91_13280 [Flavisolibacter sp.]|nr:hypothetical protein [Flavisolibacter sp.]
MKNLLFAGLTALCLLSSCRKTVDRLIENSLNSKQASGPFITYTIAKGNQYCDQSTYRALETNLQQFTVLFDSSAIYQTAAAENQYDINKLFGFSDNRSDHHQFSARIGWRWSDQALRLFAYVYNEGLMTSKEITTISIGQPAVCSIAVKDLEYQFEVNGVKVSMPRKATTSKAVGYQLYPYFGGNETAPHEIRIKIWNQ